VTVPVENIVVGGCYLGPRKRIRKVLRIAEGRVVYVSCSPHTGHWMNPGRPALLRVFARRAVRIIACPFDSPPTL
jgi:hypothetical protein